jgi:FixJ family two-component response regulator
MDKSPVIHLIDDDESFQTAVSRLLRAAGYRVEKHRSAGDFLLAPSDEAPGCILLDIRMPGPSGLDLQQALATREDRLPIVFLTGYADVAMTVRAMKAGAMDVLTKPVKRGELLRAVEIAVASHLQSRVVGKQIRNLRASYDRLTARERQVFERVVAGKPNKEIASELGTAERTVKAHRAHVMEKMLATSLAELVHLADQLGASGAPNILGNSESIGSADGH